MPPVASNPSTSDGAVAILCPHRQALGRCLGEHPITLGRGAVVVGDAVAVGCLGTLLEGTAPHRVGLCQVEQEGGTVPTDHLGALQEQGGDPLGVTHEGSEAGGGDDLDHGSQVAGGGWGCPPRLFISYSIGSPCRGSSAQIGTVPQLAQRQPGGGWVPY